VATVTFANVSVPPGGATFPAASHGWGFPAGFTVCTWMLDTSQMPVGNSFDLMTQVSYDGGKTWQDWDGELITGGTHTLKDGSVIDFIESTTPIPQPGGQYPTNARILTSNGVGTSTVGFSATLS